MQRANLCRDAPRWDCQYRPEVSLLTRPQPAKRHCVAAARSQPLRPFKDRDRRTRSTAGPQLFGFPCHRHKGDRSDPRFADFAIFESLD